ncbi:hypothetical protein BDN71DRAFT_1442113 [Pleurotus eryngii]|uniref:BRCT domain-containing protein n=1 Tax=Pleurotus eryngii TaxID=5323 RepID=A0A9P6DJJ6_PLEER|nr:hypothetical protein BDN71DRAFT_1442113 [Pleurotus eryngii]
MIFESVKYYLASCLPAPRQLELATVLDRNGASQVESIEDNSLTHVITNSPHFDGAHRVKQGVITVADKWVDRCMQQGKLQPTSIYSPDPSMLFSGVVATSTGISTTDVEVLAAGITALGGQWRTALTRDITHVFAVPGVASDDDACVPEPNTSKYHMAKHAQVQELSMKILLPHWFDDAVRLGTGSLPTEEYEWPEPKILHPPHTKDTGLQITKDTKKVERTPASKRALIRSQLWTPDGSTPIPKPSKNIWGSRKVLLSYTIGLSPERQLTLESSMERAGGVVVRKPESQMDLDEDEEETTLVDEADVLITRFRAGKAYFKALTSHKIIGSLSWLFHVHSSTILSPPTDQLLHYPLPRRGIDGFSAHEISITNYTGEAREYIKKLIETMGATFTPSMTSRNTVLIAAFISGTKTAKAQSWSIPIVNHTWLEDCFVRWRHLTVGLEKYIVFPPNVDFAKMLCERSLGKLREIEGGVLAIAAAGGEQAVSMVHNLGVTGVGRGMEVDIWAGVDEKIDGGAKTLVEAGVIADASPKTARNKGETTSLVPNTSPLSKQGNGSAVRRNPRKADHAPPGPPQATATSARDVMEISNELNPEEAMSEPEPEPQPDLEPQPESPSRRLSRKRKRRSDVRDSPERPSSPIESASPPRLRQKIVSSPKKPAVADDNDAAEDEDSDSLPEVTTALGINKVPKDADTGDAVMTNEEREDSPIPLPRKKLTRRSGEGIDLSRLGMPISLEKSQKSPNKASQVATPASPRVTMATKMRGSPAKAAPKPGPEEGDSQDDGVQVATKTKLMAKLLKPPASSATRIRKGKAKKRIEVEEEEEEETEEKVQVVAARRSKGRISTAKASTSHHASRPARTEDDSTTEVPEAPSKPSRVTKAKAKRAASLDIDPLESGADEGATVTVLKSPPVKGMKTSKQAQTTNLPVPDVGGSQRLSQGKPSAPDESNPEVDDGDDGKPTKVPKRPTPKQRDPVVQEDLEPPNADTSVASGRSRRPAAAKASQVLHDTIMPDVNMYQKHMSRSRKSGSLPSNFLQDDTKSRASTPSERPPKTKRKGVPDAEPPTNTTKPKRGASNTSPSKLSAKRSRNIRLMTTQVTLSDSVVRRLVTLGVKIVEKASECTHLLAPHLVRTEKFLCAIAANAFILKSEWATASAAANELLPEEAYFLQDDANERKYNVKLSDVLLRAKSNQGQLFTKKTFHVTPKVSIDLKLLRNVIVANGGQMTTQAPTSRTFNKENKYLISCPEDASVWRPIAQHRPVYTTELVLSGALKQEVDWDADAFKVPGSF